MYCQKTFQADYLIDNTTSLLGFFSFPFSPSVLAVLDRPSFPTLGWAGERKKEKSSFYRVERESNPR